MQAFDVGAHGQYVDPAAVHPDAVVGVDGDQYGDVVLLLGGAGFGPVDLDTGLLDEGGGDDEEDQHDEDDVEHRRQVDGGIFFGVVRGDVATCHM